MLDITSTLKGVVTPIFKWQGFNILCSKEKIGYNKINHVEMNKTTSCKQSVMTDYIPFFNKRLTDTKLIIWNKQSHVFFKLSMIQLSIIKVHVIVTEK